MSWVVRCPYCSAENQFYDCIIDSPTDFVGVECELCEKKFVLRLDRSIQVEAIRVGEE